MFVILSIIKRYSNICVFLENVLMPAIHHVYVQRFVLIYTYVIIISIWISRHELLSFGDGAAAMIFPAGHYIFFRSAAEYDPRRFLSPSSVKKKKKPQNKVPGTRKSYNYTNGERQGIYLFFFREAFFFCWSTSVQKKRKFKTSRPENETRINGNAKPNIAFPAITRLLTHLRHRRKRRILYKIIIIIRLGIYFGSTLYATMSIKPTFHNRKN